MHNLNSGYQLVTEYHMGSFKFNINTTMWSLLIILGILAGAVANCSSGCRCSKSNYDCGCCADIDIPKIHLDDSVCVNVSYLPKEYGISIILKIDTWVVINETVSARNPPPICVEVPDLKKLASICIDFYNLDIANGSFSGCVELEARLAKIFVEKVNIGCWKLGNNFYSNLWIKTEHAEQIRKLNKL